MSGALQQTLLVIDTDPAIRRSQADALATAGYRIQLADGEDQARTRLSAHVFAAVIFDAAQFPEAKTFMEAVLARDAGTALICVTSDGTLSGAVAAMRFGCADVLAKPASPARLRRAVKDALSAPIKPAAPAKAAEARQAPDLLGRSAAMRGVISLIDRFAPSTAPVLVTGESGTGKEVCAQALHSRSVRASAPFVALNCAALPKELMESEIFGHVRGAFTGADSERVGAAMAANGGTLFLDEIGEMDISLQAKLLRFLQTGEVKRVGSDAVTRVDVRIVCATNRLLPREIAAGRFREDLYYRLNILSVHMPPLRARGRDIIELASHFRSAACAEEGRTGGGFATDALEALANHRWPGNVRELQNIIRRAVILSETGHLTAGDLFPAGLSEGEALEASPPDLAGAEVIAAPGLPGSPGPLARRLVLAVMRPLAEIEREVIEAVIEVCDGNLRRAAHTLQVSPSTLYRKREAWSSKAPTAETAPAELPRAVSL